jgi:Ca2+-transporting ATPase
VREVSLATGESALTGESEPVEKDIEAIAADPQVGDRTNMVFSGTVAASGRGRAIVTSTGMETELGGIAHLLGTLEDPVTPLQREIARIGRVLGIAVIGVAIVVIASLLATSDIQGTEGLVDVLLIGVDPSFESIRRKNELDVRVFGTAASLPLQ